MKWIPAHRSLTVATNYVTWYTGAKAFTNSTAEAIELFCGMHSPVLRHPRGTHNRQDNNIHGGADSTIRHSSQTRHRKQLGTVHRQTTSWSSSTRPLPTCLLCMLPQGTTLRASFCSSLFSSPWSRERVARNVAEESEQPYFWRLVQIIIFIVHMMLM